VVKNETDNIASLGHLFWQPEVAYQEIVLHEVVVLSSEKLKVSNQTEIQTKRLSEKINLQNIFRWGSSFEFNQQWWL